MNKGVPLQQCFLNGLLNRFYLQPRLPVESFIRHLPVGSEEGIESGKLVRCYVVIVFRMTYEAGDINAHETLAADSCGQEHL